MTSVAPGKRNVLISRIEATSGMTANVNGTIERPIRAIAAVTTTIANTTSGPVQPRTPNAIAAWAPAMTSLVLGLRLW